VPSGTSGLIVPHPSPLFRREQEIVHFDAGLTQNRTKSAFCHVSGMARQGDLASGHRMAPDFVTAGSGTVEPIPEASQATRDLSVPESGEAAHLRHADRHAQVDAGIGLDQIGKGRRQRVAMLDAGLGDLAGKPLGYLRGFGDAAPFGDKARNVNACGQKATIGQLLNAETDGGLVHYRAISGHLGARPDYRCRIGIILPRSSRPQRS